MSKELKELLEQKEAIRAKIEKCEKAEDLAVLEAEMRSLTEKEEFLVRRAALLDEVNKGAGAPVGTPGKATEEVSKYDSMEYRNAFMKYVLTGGKTEIPAEYRADGVTKTTDIGAVIPDTVINRIIEKLEATGMILKEVTRTMLKGGVTYPTSAVKPVATWVAEGAGSDKQKKTTGQITFNYFKLRCAVAITLETSVMAISAFENALVANIAEAMLKAIEQAIVSGTGVGQPKGIVTETPEAGQTITVDGALTYKDVVDAEAALPLAYENNAVYVMTKKTFMGFAGQVDQAGQPIARVDHGTAGRIERSILGRRVILTEYLPSLGEGTGSGSVVAFLFNMKDYVLNTNYQMGLKRYTDEDTDDEIMKAITIADGKVIDKGSLVVLKTA
jgi:HK97 family phage major capsid protein